MAIDEETRATIVRLSRAEGWPVGTIARHCGVHHSTVTRALRDAGQAPRRRAKLIDVFVPFITEQFEKAPDLPASTLYGQVVARGYRGGEDHFRHSLRALALRPVKRPEPAMRLRFLAAEQAQVDWADFGRVQVGRAAHRLMGLLVTLSYSRQVHLSLFYNARMSSFLQGHVEAFQAFNGIPRILLYDNLKSAVVSRRGMAVTFHDTLLALARHYAFEPRAAWPRSPQEKARVERRIGFARTSFLAGRSTSAPLAELNAAAAAWCRDVAARYPWPDDDTQTVAEAFAREQEMLVPLPDAAFPTDEVRMVRIDRTCFARFESNDYSVPPDCATARLTLVAGRTTVRILDGTSEVACHPRSFDRQKRICDPEHVRKLIARKRRGRAMAERDRLLATVPRAEEMLTRAGRGNEPVSRLGTQLLALLDTHGADELDRAIAMALERGSHHPNTVRAILDERRSRQALPPLALTGRPAAPRGSSLADDDTEKETS